MSEDKKFNAALSKAEELESMDFTEEGDFNIGEYYTALEKIASQNANLKNEEAETIVSEDAESMIDEEFINELDAKKLTVENFLRKYDPNKPETQDLALEDVDRVYAISNYLLNAYIQYVNEMKFLFVFTKEEAKWLNKVLMGEIGSAPGTF
jgi:chemotaxis protein CheY-P-specific phosphatase CheC